MLFLFVIELLALTAWLCRFSSRPSRRLAFACLFALLPLSTLRAQEELPPEPSPEAPLLGVLTDNYPYCYRDAEGRLTGFSWDLTQALERTLGFKFRLFVGNTAEVFEGFRAHRIDVLQSLSYNPQREAYCEFSSPYLQMHSSILVRRGTRGINQLQDLAGKKVLVHKGSVGELTLRNNGLADSIVFVDSVEIALRRLNAGEGDATLATRLTALSTIQRLKLSNLVPAAGVLPNSRIDYCYAIQPGNQVLLNRINEGLAVLHRTGEYDKIYEKWFSRIEPRGYSVLEITLATAAGLAFALVIACVAFLRQRRLKLAISSQADRLRSSEALYRGVFESTNEGLLLLTPSCEVGAPPDYTIEQANPAALRLLFLPPKPEHCSLRLLLPGREEFCDKLRAALSPEQEPSFETELGNDSQPLWVRVSVQLLDRRLLVVLTDLSSERRAEEQLRRHEQQLQQTQKLEAIGTLASGIAHDFNNILTGVIGNAELALLDLPPDNEVVPNLREILNSSNRAKSLVRQILTFSRKAEARREVLETAGIVDEVLRFLRATTPTSITLSHKAASNLPRVHADPTQLHQVLMNLCTNGVQAMEGRNGLLEVTEDELQVGVEITALHPRLVPGRYLRIGVRDTGCGMSHEVLQRIFDPFFTTKPPGEGTGLGLAVAHGIIENHGGALTVYSKPGEGSLFHLYLPVIEGIDPAHGPATAPGAENPVPRGHGQHILFVDDEVAIVRTVDMMLTHLGYTARCFSSSREACAHFEASPHYYDAVISDLTMPLLGGLELVARVRARRPDIPFILCSGFVGEKEQALAREHRVDLILSKPLSLSQLGTALSRLLKAPASPSRPPDPAP